MRHRQDRLKAAGLSAGAALAVGVDDDVADLARGPGVALDERAADDKPGADTGTDPQQHQAAAVVPPKVYSARTAVLASLAT